jgi:hypothetical protein
MIVRPAQEQFALGGGGGFSHKKKNGGNFSDTPLCHSIKIRARQWEKAASY